MTKSDALTTLANGKHRITRTRGVILDAMLSLERHVPFSAAEIFTKVKAKRVDLVTIYRNLQVFERAGLICRADFSDEVARFIFSGGEHHHHHHHIICRECGRVTPVDACLVEQHEAALRRLGFRDIQHRLEFSGVCRSCD